MHGKARKETADIGKRNRKQAANKEITDDNCAVPTKLITKEKKTGQSIEKCSQKR